MYMPELDDKDIEILNLIKDNARMSYSEIGEKVGLSRVAVKNRIDSMEKRGVILGYETKIVAPRRPENVSFVMDITTSLSEHENVLKRLSEIPTVLQVLELTGKCRIFCICVSPNQEMLRTFVRELYKNVSGIERLEFSAVMSVEKKTEVDDGQKFIQQEVIRGNRG